MPDISNFYKQAKFQIQIHWMSTFQFKCCASLYLILQLDFCSVFLHLEIFIYKTESINKTIILSEEVLLTAFYLVILGCSESNSCFFIILTHIPRGKNMVVQQQRLNVFANNPSFILVCYRQQFDKIASDKKIYMKERCVTKFFHVGENCIH